MEELESATLTRLAEVMLHPPTSVVGNKYCWGEDDERRALEEAARDGGDDDESGDDDDDEGSDDERPTPRTSYGKRARETHRESLAVGRTLRRCCAEHVL